MLSMFGFMGWVYHFTGYKQFYFTMMNTSMPIVMLTIANSDGVHVLSRFFKVTPLRKMSIGFWIMGLAFGMVSIIQYFIDSGEILSVGWQVLACFFLTASEVMISITCLEFAYTQAPKSMKSLVMALYLLTVSLGNFLTSQVKFLLIMDDGTSWLSRVQEFWFWTIIVLIAAFAFIFVSRSYKPQEYLHESE